MPNRIDPTRPALSRVRRVGAIAFGVLVGLAVIAGALGAGFATTMGRSFALTQPATALPERTLTHPDGRLRVAVLLGSTGTVSTDALGPYGVLARSSRFDVYTVSVDRAPVVLSGGLTALPDYGVDDLRSGAAPWPDILVVPAVVDPAGTAEAPLRDLIEDVHAEGGIVLGVCAGARLLAETSVLEGRRATSFWSDIDGLRSAHPETEWVAGKRWVEDGDVITTAGVSSGIAAALHLVVRVAGEKEARKIARDVAYPGWSPSASTDIPVNSVAFSDYPYALAAVLPWGQPRYGLGLEAGVDEIDIAAAAELYGGVAYVAQVVPVAAEPVVTTAHGFRLLASPIDAAGHLDRLVVPSVSATAMHSGDAPVFLPQASRPEGNPSFDPIFADLAHSHGADVAATAAKYIEYPLPGLADATGFPSRIVGLAIVTVIVSVLTGILAGLTPGIVGRRRRERA